MLTPQVLCSEPIHEAGMQLIREVAGIVIAPDSSEETLVNLISDADALIVRSSDVTARIIKAGKKLKVIGRHGIGIDNIDLETATSMGVAVINTPLANVQSVAEHVLAMMLCLCKRISKADRALRSGLFNRPGSLPGLVNKLGYNAEELFGKTVGLVGFGKIGRRVGQMCKAGFDMQVYAYDKFLSEDYMRDAGVEPCNSLSRLFRRADFISVHLPLTPGTKNLIGLDLLSLMKPTAFIINTSRGGIINEDDLCAVLKEKRIAGAAVDVFSQEPPPVNHPLFQLNNVIVTPHMAAMTDGALERMARDVAAGVVSVLRGEKPEFLVNPVVWD
jgi:D-3-phosphoglycerate dehydrogenase